MLWTNYILIHSLRLTNNFLFNFLLPFYTQHHKYCMWYQLLFPNEQHRANRQLILTHLLKLSFSAHSCIKWIHIPAPSFLSQCLQLAKCKTISKQNIECMLKCRHQIISLPEVWSNRGMLTWFVADMRKGMDAWTLAQYFYYKDSFNLLKTILLHVL